MRWPPFSPSAVTSPCVHMHMCTYCMLHIRIRIPIPTCIWPCAVTSPCVCSPITHAHARDPLQRQARACARPCTHAAYAYACTYTCTYTYTYTYAGACAAARRRRDRCVHVCTYVRTYVCMSEPMRALLLAVDATGPLMLLKAKPDSWLRSQADELWTSLEYAEPITSKERRALDTWT